MFNNRRWAAKKSRVGGNAFQATAQEIEDTTHCAFGVSQEEPKGKPPVAMYTSTEHGEPSAERISEFFNDHANIDSLAHRDLEEATGADSKPCRGDRHARHGRVPVLQGATATEEIICAERNGSHQTRRKGSRCIVRHVLGCGSQGHQNESPGIHDLSPSPRRRDPDRNDKKESRLQERVHQRTTAATNYPRSARNQKGALGEYDRHAT
jgi:hypothetical protein